MPDPRELWLEQGRELFGVLARTALACRVHPMSRRPSWWWRPQSAHMFRRYQLVRFADAGGYHAPADRTGYLCDICPWVARVSDGAVLIAAHEQSHIDAWLRDSGYVLPYEMDPEERAVLADALMSPAPARGRW